MDSSDDGEGPLSVEREKDVYSLDEETDGGKDNMDDSQETEDSTYTKLM